MAKYLRIALLCLSLVIGATCAQAVVVDFSFDPNDLVDLYAGAPGGSKATQENARLLVSGTTQYGTVSDQTNYNSYLNWLDGLGTTVKPPAAYRGGEGIGAFNIYLGSVYSTTTGTWGQTVKLKSGIVSATGDSSHLWQPWDLGQTPGYIQWYTGENDNYLKPDGVDLGIFTFKADVYNDANGNGVVDAGEENFDSNTCRLLCSGVLLRFDDQGWGTLANANAAFDSSAYPNSTRFYGTLNANAAVPEPMSIILGIMGLGSIAGYRRFRK